MKHSESPKKQEAVPVLTNQRYILWQKTKMLSKKLQNDALQKVLEKVQKQDNALQKVLEKAEKGDNEYFLEDELLWQQTTDRLGDKVGNCVATYLVTEPQYQLLNN